MTRLVSLVIAVVLTLQVAATFDLFPRLVSRPSYLFWPFLDYPMYRSARYEGSVIERYRVLGRLADGSEVEVSPGDLGLSFRKFRDILVAAIRGADRPRVAAFAELYRIRTGTRLIAMRAERHGETLTRDGLRPAPPVQLPAVSLQTQ
jgi:hypothetical protein